MSIIVIRSFRKQSKHIRHQPIQKHAQEQDEQQVQPMGDEPVNAPNTNATHRGKINEQYQNVPEPIVQRILVTFSTIHQKTPQRITQLKVVSVHNDDNHEPI